MDGRKLRKGLPPVLSGAMLALALLSPGCGVTDGMDNVGKKTDEMNRTTKGMSEETKRMREETERMRKETERMRQETERMRKETEAAAAAGRAAAEAGDKAAAAGHRAAEGGEAAADLSEYIYHDARQGDSLRVRAEQLAALDAEKDQEAKIAAAGKYFRAFEFQLWRGDDARRERKRSDLFNDAVLEFFRSTNGIADYARNFDIQAGDNRSKNLFALAAALHLLNPVQEEHLAPEERTSMLDLVTQGLGAVKSIQSGIKDVSGLTGFERCVAEKHREALRLLQTRANVLAVMVLSKVSNAQGRGVFGLEGLFARASMLVLPWSARLAEVNAVELSIYVEWMEMAVETRDALTSLGYDAGVDPRLVKTFANMRFEDARSSRIGGGGGGGAGQDLAATTRAFAQAVGAYIAK